MKTKYFSIIAAAFALVACDKNNDDFNIDNTKDTPITIVSAGVAELTTRAVSYPLVGTDASSPATIGVFVTGGSETKYDAANVEWEHGGSSWEKIGNETMLYEGAGSKQTIYACSPYSESAAAGTITVSATDRTDWLVATATPLTSNSVSLMMNHALTKLILKVSGYGAEVSENDRNIQSVKVGNMYASGTLYISDNSWSGLSETPDATLTMTDYELLVISMASCTSFPITITMADNRIFKATISLSGVGNKLEAGTQYKITLQVGQDKVTLGDITASPWKNMDGGELDTE